jgi:hypothetical protein
MKKIVKLKVLSDYRIEIEFDDGIQGVVDLSSLVGQGVFSSWKEYENFKKASISSLGELVWQNGADLCPDSLYLKITGKSPADIFPALKAGKKRA